MAPQLSVVVPVYNVEQYLEECLDSIAAQTFTDFECVMVDDGSTDSSAALAERYVAKDSRFRLVRQENKGLGAARNTGYRNISPGSTYLTFVDSDDTVPSGAYRLMISTLEQTGSDFVTGNTLRLRIAGLQPSGAHRRAFGRTRLQTHVSEFPALLTDRTAWNKVYRRSFFDAAGVLYPEGILYEDAPVSVPHHFLAKSVDVLSEPIYHWRIREDGASITQQRTDTRGLTDRVRSMQLVREWLQARPEAKFREEYLAAYDANCLTEEIPMFFSTVPDGDANYRAAYQESVSRLLREIGVEKLEGLRPLPKLKYRLTLEDRMDSLVTLQRLHRRYRKLRG